jgi:acyl-homoserine-lactone acylase
MRCRNLLLALATIVLAAPATASAKRYDVTIKRDRFGIPHISGKSYADVAYGYGYAIAQDNICVLADTYVTVDAERSKYFGPDGSYLQRGNGQDTNNLDSDLFFQQINDSKHIEELLAKPAPNGPLPGIKSGMRGYVAGYNRYLKDVGGTDGVEDAACKGKPWVKPISEQTAYRRLFQLIELASGDVVINGIGEAQPPTPALTGGAAAFGAPFSPESAAAAARTMQSRLKFPAGSNAIAVGKDGTRDGKHGLLLGNPHFPWVGPERFYQAHLTIPGKVNVAGGSLYGVPVILIGHTDSMAWSHTVSTAYRFTPYQLTLVPGSPTQYLQDGAPVAMTSRDVTVQVKQEDGSIKPLTRTLWSTRYGPMINSLVGVPLPWTPAAAFTYRDANVNNFRSFNHFFATNRAQSVAAELKILRKYQGIPWVNTIVADRTGHALYADIGAIPNVPDALAQSCNSGLGTATYQLLGLPVLDGSRTACDWAKDDDAAEEGLFGPSHMPVLERSDYVTNSNDSYWLSNPKKPLEGFARIIGDQRTARTLRTRIGLIMTQTRIDGTDKLGPKGFTVGDMQRLDWSDRQYAGELTRDALVAMCQGFGGSAPSSSGPVAVGNACDVLAKWDLHENLDSRGALLFRRFWAHASGATPSPYSEDFDVSDPVNTPRGLATDNPQVQAALGDAISDLQGANIAFDAPLGDLQFLTRHGARIPIHGGTGDPNGQFNAINASWNGKGFDEVNFGSSFMQVVGWNNGRCPVSRTMLSYSESSNLTSPHSGDQTKLFSRKRWIREPFCPAAVRKATRSTKRLRG